MSQSLRFGPVEIDPEARQLRVDGQPAALGARAFDLLMALVRRRDRVVSKGELLQVVWPGLVVEENNLQVQVSTLRKLLGPQAISTVPGRGYRFTAAGAEGAASTAATPSAAPAEAAATGDALLGRDADLAALESALASHRLVTIVGPGGIGKTRLAEAAASRQAGRGEHAVCWVDLAPLRDSAQVAAALAAALGLTQQDGAPDRAGDLPARLRAQHALVVLDNCEHLLDAVAALVQPALAPASAAAGPAGVRWLLTSQQPLRLPQEQVLRLGTLSVAPRGSTAAEALAHGAVALLARQAARADQRFLLTDANVAAAIDLCEQLDGIALAIEMAAARIPMLGLDGVRTRLHERLRFLAAAHRAPLPHQQTLQAALQWSHSLLSPMEQVVLRRLAPFVGGFTLELAQQQACSGPAWAAGAEPAPIDDWAVLDALAALVDKSLVQTGATDADGAPRYRLLETTRMHALAQLDAAGERPAAMARHAEVMARFAERCYDAHWTMADAPWLQRMEPEIDNLDAALRRALALDDADTAAAIVGSSWPLFRLLDRQHQGQAWMDRAAPLLQRAGPRRAARALTGVTFVYSGSGFRRSLEAAREAVQRQRELGDVHGLYLALSALAYAALWFGDDEDSGRRETDAALAELDTLDGPAVPARLRCWAGIGRQYRCGDDHAQRLRLLSAMQALARSCGATERELTAQLLQLMLLIENQRLDEAAALACELVQPGRLRGERLGMVHLRHADVLVKQGRHADARGPAAAALRVLRECGDLHHAYAELAGIAIEERRHADGALLIGHVGALIAGLPRGADMRALLDANLGSSGSLTALDEALGRERRERLVGEGALLGDAQAAEIALRLPGGGSGAAIRP